VQVMIEGPWHIPMDQIELQVKKEMELCTKRRFTRWAAGDRHRSGYDHITSAIGAAMIAGRRVDAVLRHAEGASGLAQRVRT